MLAHCMQATVPVLWLMPALQLLLLLFFTSVAVSHWIYNWVLLAPCLMTGTAQPYSASWLCCGGVQNSSTYRPALFLLEVPMHFQQPASLSVIWFGMQSTSLPFPCKLLNKTRSCLACISVNWLLNIHGATYGRLGHTAPDSYDEQPAV